MNGIRLVNEKHGKFTTTVKNSIIVSEEIDKILELHLPLRSYFCKTAENELLGVEK